MFLFSVTQVSALPVSRDITSIPPQLLVRLQSLMLSSVKLSSLSNQILIPCNQSSSLWALSLDANLVTPATLPVPPAATRSLTRPHHQHTRRHSLTHSLVTHATHSACSWLLAYIKLLLASVVPSLRQYIFVKLLRASILAADEADVTRFLRYVVSHPLRQPRRVSTEAGVSVVVVPLSSRRGVRSCRGPRE